jgi:hypothetical protein
MIVISFLDPRRRRSTSSPETSKATPSSAATGCRVGAGVCLAVENARRERQKRCGSQASGCNERAIRRGFHSSSFGDGLVLNRDQRVADIQLVVKNEIELGLL